MTLWNNRAPLLCYFKLCASFRSHWWIQTWVTVRKHPILVKLVIFLSRMTLKFGGIALKNTRAPFLCYSKLCPFIAIGKFKLELQSGNAQIGAKFVLTSVILTFDLWPWRVAWTSLLSVVITSENFMVIRWQEHCEKGVTGRRRDRSTGRPMSTVKLTALS